jgi:hypothetical protein
VGHKRIAENSNTLSRDYSLDGMKLFSEAQMLHAFELRNMSPFALRTSKPSLPCRWLAVGRRPVAMDENVLGEVSRTLQTAR